jgi:hypothetical protein
MRRRALFWKCLLAANLLVWGMLGLLQTSSGQERKPQQPFANAEEQRLQIIELLQETNALLKEQNALLRSGKLQVVVAPRAGEGAAEP